MRFPELHFRWHWHLRASPEALWPLVSDTNRFNRDTGLPGVHRLAGGAGENARQHLSFSRFGFRLEWEEEPFEWLRPYRFSVRRFYRVGPVASAHIDAELTRTSPGGTHLQYHSRIRPRNILGLLLVPVAMHLYLRRVFGTVFRRYDALTLSRDPHQIDVRDDVSLMPGAKTRLALIRERLAAATGESEIATRLAAAVETLDDFAMSRLRPYAIADAWGVDRRAVLEACLHATRLGLFDLQWDVLCPRCRGVKASSTTLAEMPDGVHCDACNIDFAANFDRAVEVTFRPNAAIRLVDDRSYCVGGPQVTPHIIAQRLLGVGEARDAVLPLEPGRYRIRASRAPGAAYFVASADRAGAARMTANAASWPPDEPTLTVCPTLTLLNETGREQLVIVERMRWSDQATTAADVTSLQLFRDLFARELLRPGAQISLGSLTVLFTDLRDSTSLYRSIGDAPAFARVLDHFSVLRAAIAAEGGAVVKTIGDAVMAVFSRPYGAVRAMHYAQQQLRYPEDGGTPLALKAGIHYGPCLAVTLNERLDYFGTTINLASRLERFSLGEDIIMSQAVWDDPEVQAWLASEAAQFAAERFEARVKGFDERPFTLWRLTGAPAMRDAPGVQRARDTQISGRPVDS